MGAKRARTHPDARQSGARYASSHRAVREMKADGQLAADTKLRSSKYLNNLIEQDHRASSYASVQCSASSGSGPRRSQLPASNCFAGFTRDSSTSAACASKIEVRPPSGMRYWRRRK
jgi:hypothetical protein